MLTPIVQSWWHGDNSTDMSELAAAASRAFESMSLVHLEAAGSSLATGIGLWNRCVVAIACRVCGRSSLAGQSIASPTPNEQLSAYFDLRDLTRICALASRERMGQSGGVVRVCGIALHKHRVATVSAASSLVMFELHSIDKSCLRDL